MTIFLLVVAIILFIVIKRAFKIPKCGNMILVTGGVKTGKSTLSVRLVYKLWRKQKLKVRFQNVLLRLLKWLPKFKDRKPKPMPLIYSNIPLILPYVPMTTDLLQRKSRFVYGSVIYLCESSLVADSMSFKDAEINEQLLLFNKLIAHETKGGYLVYDTQSISDNHFAVKRCLSTYFFIHHKIVVPFFFIAFVREFKFSEDNSAVNTISDDVEEGLKMVIVPKRTWKYFDCYCYSALTDDLPVTDNVKTHNRDLKARDIISFKKWHTIKKKKDGEK